MNITMATNSPEPDHTTRLLLGMTPPQPPPPPPPRPPRQEPEAEGRMIRTLLDLLISDKMDGSDQVNQSTRPGEEEGSNQNRWSMLKQRLRLKGIGCCCGSATCPPPPLPGPLDDRNDDLVEEVVEMRGEEQQEVAEIAQPTPPPGMNLAMALAAERVAGGAVEVAAERVSLMKLMDEEREEEVVDMGCCVCMERKKGAAMIPCGHTYCRDCCQQVWLNRGTCPLCNRPILDILYLY